MFRNKPSSFQPKEENIKPEFQTLRKRHRIRSVISANYHYITVLCPFNLFIAFIYYHTV